ncbi:ribokinase [Agrobacterium genomosp. 3]|uniref:ribokinase n=1 Tax=Agrobacterium tomkonis TaxID=1183410 RepID=UPI001CD85744|nr:ribokinase [Agrobacterium tomkonis]MCA1879264.1 ribokinase [Agrobacterium tumefaciens]MCA1894427.1 ribokinase [Agrobacterium tomkonis]
MTPKAARPVTILGIFVADTAYTAARLPNVGETLGGSSFTVGPGGKGSNQAVAAARAGADVHFISRLGDDDFGHMALKTYEQANVTTHIKFMDDVATGAAFIFINENTAENAIIVCPGAAGTLSAEDAEAARAIIEGAAVFVTQLEQPAAAARRGLEIARAAGVMTILNPSPADQTDDGLLELTDILVPNEGEAAALCGFEVDTLDRARRAGDVLMARGVGHAIITLGSRGVLVHGPGISEHIPAKATGEVVDTSGAGDAFLGSFAAAISEGYSPLQAAEFATVAAGIAVTRRGTAAAMPTRQEIDTAGAFAGI